MIGSRDSDAVRGIARRVALLAAGVILLSSGCGSTSQDKVLVVERTRSYHRATCPRVNMAYTLAMTREEAQALDCKPCPDCRPDSRR
jgi:hypothetical protein